MSVAVHKRRNQPTAGGNQLGLPREAGKLLCTIGNQEFPEDEKLEESQCSVFIFLETGVWGLIDREGLRPKRAAVGYLTVFALKKAGRDNVNGKGKICFSTSQLELWEKLGYPLESNTSKFAIIATICISFDLLWSTGTCLLKEFCIKCETSCRTGTEL